MQRQSLIITVVVSLIIGFSAGWLTNSLLTSHASSRSVEAWHGSTRPLPISGEDSVAPPIQPPISPAKTFEIVSVDGKVTERNDVWWKYAWQLTLHNTTESPVVVDATIEFADKDGFPVDDDREYGLSIEAGETKTFTGYTLVETSVAPNIERVGAKVNAQ